MNQYPKPTPTKRFYVFRAFDRNYPPLETMEFVSRHTRPEETWRRVQNLCGKNRTEAHDGKAPLYWFYRVHFTAPGRSPEIERYG